MITHDLLLAKLPRNCTPPQQSIQTTLRINKLPTYYPPTLCFLQKLNVFSKWYGSFSFRKLLSAVRLIKVKSNVTHRKLQKLHFLAVLSDLFAVGYTCNGFKSGFFFFVEKRFNGRVGSVPKALS